MSDRLISMVATDRKVRLAPGTLKEALKSFLHGSEGEPHIVQAKGETNSLVVTLAGVSVALVCFPFTIPPATLASAIGNELLWRGGAQAFGQSTGHVLLAVVSPGNDPTASMAQAQVLTLVTAATVSVTKGKGIFWASADAVIEPSRFLDETREIRGSPFAASLWFSVRFFPGSPDESDARLVCQSTGLTIFLGREIECGPYTMGPGEFAETVLMVARYMASAGPIFGDGHTLAFGDSGGVDARIRFDWSPLGGVNRPVFRLELASQEAMAR